MLIGMPVSISAGIVSGDWLELIDTTKLPVLRDDECFLVSSYDRLGGNNDGFFGTFSFLRIEEGAFVLFDEDGPGCIYRIWSANPGLNRIEFYFDGEATPRLVFDNWLDMFRNRLEPFVDPVSTFALGGCVSYVPIPYATSLKIVARDRPKFYQFTYQKFADTEDIETFQPAMDAGTYARYSRVKGAWNNPGAPPWPEAIEAEQTSVASIPPGASGDLVSLIGTGTVYSLDLDGIAKSQFRHISLRIQVDENLAQVDCPLNAFFVQGSGRSTQGALLAGRRDDGSLYSYWPMPFRTALTVSLVNGSEMPAEVSLTVGYRDETPETLDGLGLFHARYLAPSRTERGEPYEILHLDGRGHWCGVNLMMRKHGPGLSFLEGDERVWVDERSSSSYHGTGTEDYFNGGWYFGGTGWRPLWGCTRIQPLRGRCDAFRLHLTDVVPFQQSIRVAIEHGTRNRLPVRYGSVAFYYLAPQDVE